MYWYSKWHDAIDDIAHSIDVISAAFRIKFKPLPDLLARATGDLALHIKALALNAAK